MIVDLTIDPELDDEGLPIGITVRNLTGHGGSLTVHEDGSHGDNTLPEEALLALSFVESDALESEGAEAQWRWWRRWRQQQRQRRQRQWQRPRDRQRRRRRRLLERRVLPGRADLRHDHGLVPELIQ